MFARTLGLAIVVMAGCAFGLEAVGAQKDKDTPKTKKFEVPKDAIAGKVKAVNMKEPTFTLTLASGKDRIFAVDATTEFWGPKGGDRGTGPAGLKDDCMEKGYEIKVVATKDGKTAKDVYLPNRKTEKKTDVKKDKL
jgi:hypothetical protein